jgi:hypothetical protein
MIHGIHKALVALGALTIVSTIVFRSLKRGDGDAVSNEKSFIPAVEKSGRRGFVRSEQVNVRQPAFGAEREKAVRPA